MKEHNLHLSNSLMELVCYLENRLFHVEWMDVFFNLSSSKQIAANTVYPNRGDSGNCTLMFLSNLAEVEWIQVDCQQTLLHHLVCDTQNQPSVPNNIVTKTKTCKSQCILNDGKCYDFTWCSGKSGAKIRRIPQGKSFRIHFLLKAIRPDFPPIYLNSASGIEKWIGKMYLSVSVYQTELDLLSNSFGFCLTRTKSEYHMPHNIIRYQNQTYVSQTHLCDGNSDSQKVNRECDESMTLKKCKESKQPCKKRVCSPLCYLSLRGDCHKYIHENHRSHFTAPDKLDDITFFACADGKLINSLLVDDFVSDCGSEGEDEPLLKLSVSNENDPASCRLPYELPCYPDHSKCHNITDICVLRLNAFKHLVPCRNGGHLYNCVDFECNAMFKCPQSFCVPWEYICDGQWECSDGADEAHFCTKMARCHHMYICHQFILTCVHISNLCDGIQNCPLLDDEDFCDLANSKCPHLCHCVMYAMKCARSHHLSHLILKIPFVFLEIQQLYNFKLAKLFEMFPNLLFAHLTNNNLSEVCENFRQSNIIVLNVSHNKISRIKVNCFQNMSKIFGISLTHNNISLIAHQSFSFLCALKYLDLSFNPIQALPSNTLNNISLKLFVLHASYVHIDKMFSSNAVEVVDTNNCHICCLELLVSKTCSSSCSWFITCSSLLLDNDIFACLVTIFVISFMTNLLSFGAHFTHTTSHKAFYCSVKSLNVSNKLFVFYTCVIWISHIVYGTMFFLEEHKWRSHPMCYAAFTTILLFLGLDQCVVTFIALSKLMVVIKPVVSPFKRSMFIARCLLSMFATVLVIVISMTLYLWYSSIKLPLSLCIPFADPQKSFVLFQVITHVVVISQVLCAVIISVFHLLIYQKVYESQTSAGRTKADTKSKNDSLLIQLVVLSFTAVVCWVPAGVIHTTLMYVQNYPLTIVHWTMVLLVPVNCIMYPASFIFVHVRKTMWQSKQWYFSFSVFTL